MLARSEKLCLPNGDVMETPILLPSFSSKGFPDLKKIIKHLEEYLSGPFLISAYDLNYGLIQERIKFANKLVFVDSGGYECTSIVDFTENDKNSYRPRKWNYALYCKTIRDYLSNETPKIVISYDHPKVRRPIEEQLLSAKTTFNRLQKSGRMFLTEFLVKPETRERDKQYVNVESLIRNIRELINFDIIGFTEKELGKSLLDRINNITKIRYELSGNNMKQLLHIFGSLDTISTPLYFICGADIFDGLTWLRYSYNDGYTIYQQNHWISNLSFNRDDVYLRQTTFIRNYDYLQDLTLKMKRFLKSHSFEEFAPHADLLEKAWNSVDKRGGL